MIKFAVYSKVKLIKKPSWLNKFEKDYIKEDWHVTLKQTCYIDKSQVPDIKNRLKELNKELKFKNGKINIEFNKLVADKEKESGGITIMIRANNKEVDILQKKVVLSLKGYNNYNEKESKIWEKNFHPHLTITSSIDAEEYLKAKSYMGKDHTCKGIIDSFTFISLNDDGSKKRVNYKFL